MSDEKQPKSYAEAFEKAEKKALRKAVDDLDLESKVAYLVEQDFSNKELITKMITVIEKHQEEIKQLNKVINSLTSRLLEGSI